MSNLLVLPIAVPLATMAVLLLSWKSRQTQKVLSVVGSLLLLVAATVLLATVRRDGIIVLHVGSWQAPFGITLVADLLTSIMVMLAGVMATAVSVYALATVDDARVDFGFHSLFHLLMMGVCGAFLTGDIFNLYVWFEVMLIASFVLLALGGERGQLEGAIKYVTLNLISSAVFLAAIGVLYAATGTLNMADLALKLRSIPDENIVSVLAMLFLIAFGTKAAAFPLFFWLPASYHTPPAVVSAIFAGLLTKVGVYALFRAFTLLFVSDTAFTHTLLLVIAGLTMVTGVLGAMAQYEIRRILSFHIVSQIGYMLMGLALFTPLALAGSIFYIIHHIVVKTNLFLIGGIVERRFNSGRLNEIGGLVRTAPVLTGLFFVSAMSLAGIPPLSGFFAKLTLIQAGLEAKQYAIVAAALAVSLLTLYSMTKIWSEAFWKTQPSGTVPEASDTRSLTRRERCFLFAPAIVLATITLGIGVMAGSVMEISMAAAEQLLHPDLYINAVLGGESTMNRFLSNILLAMVWALAGGQISLTSLAVGFVLGYFVLWVAQPVMPPTRYFQRLPRAVRFAGYFLWQLLLSNLRVAYDVITPRLHMRPGIVAIPLDAKTDQEITLLANLITLTPGTLSLDVSEDRRFLYVHAMFVDDVESFRDSIKNGFERRLLELMR